MPAKDSAIQIRQFDARDLQRILAIERATFAREAYTTRIFRELYHDCAELFFVATRFRRIVGYMVTCTESKQAEIVSIGVHPNYQKLGIGTRLMEHTVTELSKRKIQRVELMVRTTNTAGAHFYRKFGFMSAGRVARYYEDGGDAIRMKKILGLKSRTTGVGSRGRGRPKP